MAKTIREIAKEAGVSITTVSKLINGEEISISKDTRERVLETVKKYNYVGNTGAKRKKSSSEKNQIAIVIPELKQMFFAEILEQVEKYCDESGNNLIVCSSRNDFEREKQHIADLIKMGIKGIVYMSVSSTTENCYEDLKKAKIPFVVLDSNLIEYNVPAIAFVDGENGMYSAAKYLIECGHQDIAYITGVRHAKFNNSRHQGYVRALLESGLPVNPQLTAFGNYTYESGGEKAAWLLEHRVEFTALLCENDLIAIGAMRKLEEHGLRVPDDISIIGFDDIYINEMIRPQLTSVNQNLHVIAKEAVDMLIRLADGEVLDNTVVKVTPRLILRNSVKIIENEK